MVTWILLLGLWAQADAAGDREVTLMMHERFAYATMLRTSLIHGFLERGLRHAGQLEGAIAEMNSPALVEAVGITARATSLDEAAAGAARIAEACGACHEQNDVRVVVLGENAAPWNNTLAARMGRHIWAADRMWAGLIGHSDEAWVRGAQLLVDDPFHARGPGSAGRRCGRGGRLE